MSIFSTIGSSEERFNLSESCLRNVVVKEYASDDSIMESWMSGLLESEMEWNNIIMTEAAREYAMLESTGEVVLTEGAIADFFRKVIEWFRNLWAKIAGVFKKALSAFGAYVNNSADYYLKNKKLIEKGYANFPTDGFKIKGRKDYPGCLTITLTNIKAGDQAVSEIKNHLNGIKDETSAKEAKEEVKKFSEVVKEAGDVARSGLCGESGKVSSSEFKDKFKKYVCGEKVETIKKSDIDLKDIEKIMTRYEIIKAGTAKVYKDVQHQIDNAIKEVNLLEKQFKNGEDDDYAAVKMDYCRLASACLKETRSIMGTASSLSLQFIKEYLGFAKNLCGKLVSKGRGDKGFKEESAINTSESLDALFM